MWIKHNSDCIKTKTHMVCRVPKNKTEFNYVAYNKLKTGGWREFAKYETADEAKRRCRDEAKHNGKAKI